MTTTAAPAKPVPVPDQASAPFFDGALRGELMLLRCRACATFMSPTTSLLRLRMRRMLRVASNALATTRTDTQERHPSHAGR